MWGMILLVLVGPSAPQESAKRLGEVRGFIQANGARQALSTLFADDQRWDLMLDDIATGTQEWLSVAAELRAVSDAHAGATLAMAIQEALPRNPVGVLGLVAAQRFTVADACGMYGFGQIEDERPMRVLLGLVDKRTDAVSRVTKRGLSAVRDGCLKELRSLRVALQEVAG